ncbi:MAG: sulfotransferase [Candidatus Binatia bacterium]
MRANPPIFLRPSGRTGGTLFVSMLDAHPKLAMSYEIYEDRLFGEAGDPLDLSCTIEMLERARQAVPVAWVRSIPDRNFRTFVARARRADVEVDELLGELARFAAEGKSFDSIDGRLDFIDRLMIYRKEKAGKNYWGGKAAADLYVLNRRHPQAVFFAMVRDGRDVLASRLNTGNFQTSALDCARDWRDKILEFQCFCKRTGAKAQEIIYEQLVKNPEAVMRSVCALIGVEYDPIMLSFAELDMALFRNPHGHLSHRQIREGLNKNSIGRWRRDLSSEDIAVFSTYCADILAAYGYV